MSAQYKAFILVFLVAMAVFVIGKPLFTRFMAAEDFVRRRNIWLALTAASFLSPSIWLYALIAVPLMFYGARKDPNPVALYFFLLLAVPPVRIQIPTLGLVGQVFPIDHLRLLSLALLLPVAMQLRGSARTSFSEARRDATRHPLTLPDFLLLAYLGLQIVLAFPYESTTSSLRRIALLFIDVGLPYFVVSRACRDSEKIAEAMASFVLATAILAPLAVFEFLKGWMLFAGIQDQWGGGRMFFPLFRGNFLRAQVTAGHSINLGYYMAMAFGMWLFLQGRAAGSGWRFLCFATVITGMVVALARGPWLGAAIVLLSYLSMGPRAGGRLVKGIVAVSGICAVLWISPWSAQIIDHLPYIGTIDAQTIIQREQLAAGSWLVIQQNPWFGSPYFLRDMEEFRTGEGIIDLVNTYAAVALSFGLVGASIFGGVFFVLLWRLFRVVRLTGGVDPDFSHLGASLLACMVGTLLVIATTSFQLALPNVAWGIAALGSAYLSVYAATFTQQEVNVVIGRGMPILR